MVVINEATAQTYWPDQDPLGKHVKLWRGATSWATVVGVVANARTESLENANIPGIYASLYQQVAHKKEHHLAIFLRGQLDPAAIPDEVRTQVQAVDPTIPVFGAETVNDTVSASLAQRRFSMEMVALFALTALLLAAIGIYGVISYMFEIWVGVALLGLWSCVGVIYSNSRKTSRQMDEVVRLLTTIAAK